MFVLSMLKKKPLPPLSAEQERMIQKAVLYWRNVLVDARIGSGKTTAIQALCNRIPADKFVVYLTYNKSLKEDAQHRIDRRYGMVTNYHGFALHVLSRNGFRSGNVSEFIREHNRHFDDFSYYPIIDVLILDEYQDIDSDAAEMLIKIKERMQEMGVNMQIIAVGDMFQKIYDRTALDAQKFIIDYLGPQAVRMEFTQSFRMSEEWAKKLSFGWGQQIVGVNPDLKVRTVSYREALRKAKATKPGDLLVLGSNRGKRNTLLNDLERAMPDVYNKHTAWSKVTDSEGDGSVSPDADSAIFTTYDACKGMERDVCIVFDFTPEYLMMRLKLYQGASPQVIRNMFFVAASRGKKEILFVRPAGSGSSVLSPEDIPDYTVDEHTFSDVDMSTMFQFKYIEDVEDCFGLLQCTCVEKAGDVIDVPLFDGLIDISACIGIRMECEYFINTEINTYIEAALAMAEQQGRADLFKQHDYEKFSLNVRVLFHQAIVTNLFRYFGQADPQFVTQEQLDEMRKRLSEHFPEDADTQVPVSMLFHLGKDVNFIAKGLLDVLMPGDVIWELKFVSQLTHEHFLQLASYMTAYGTNEGYLFNVKNGEIWKVEIPDEKTFLNQLTKTVTKRKHTKFHGSLVGPNGIRKI